MEDKVRKVRIPEWALEEQQAIIKGLQAENVLLRGKVNKLAKALDSDVRIIKQAGDIIRGLNEKLANYEKVLKAHGLMTLDGRMTVIQ